MNGNVGEKDEIRGVNSVFVAFVAEWTDSTTDAERAQTSCYVANRSHYTESFPSPLQSEGSFTARKAS